MEIMKIESSVRDQSEPFRPISDPPDSHENGDSHTSEVPPSSSSRTNGSLKRHRTPPRTRPRPESGVSNVPEVIPEVAAHPTPVVIDTSSDEDDKPISAIIKENHFKNKKVKIDRQIMDEAIFNLISQDG